MDLETFGETPKKSFFDNLGGYFIEFFETVVVVGAIFALIYTFVAQFHKVSGSSMVPTFHDGDFLITEKISYLTGSPKRGDIIVLKNPRDETQEFIKRIVALPGDTVKVAGDSVYINGQLSNEKYLPADTPTHSGAFITEDSTVKAGPNQYFAFGDNRNHSSDSRDWGSLTRKEIVGKAFFRYWPPQVVGYLGDR